MSFWRHRNGPLWKSAKPTGGHQPSRATATEDKDADVQNEIKDLHHAAPRPKDASTITKAAAAERWVKDNVKALALAEEALGRQKRPLP